MSLISASNVVVSALALLLLQLDGDTSDGGSLETLHQVSDKSGDLIPERLGGNKSHLLDDIEVQGEHGVVLLDDDLLHGLGTDATHLEAKVFDS
jgi:hypothetical protein